MKFYICEKIGRKWKRLARYLEIGDGDIDEIEEHRDNTTLTDKCRAVLNEFNKHGVLRWNQLKGALIDIGLTAIKSDFEEKYSSDLRNRIDEECQFNQEC